MRSTLALRVDAGANAAARALAQGDPLGALSRVALRDDAPALALRGIAMAQLGELSTASDLLSRALVAFGQREPLARARCVVARAEVALALRELTLVPDLTQAIETLTAAGDTHNAIHARVVAARTMTLLGDREGARDMLPPDVLNDARPTVRAVGGIVLAEGYLRGLEMLAAQRALVEAGLAATRAGIGALRTEVARLQASLSAPAVQIQRAGELATASLLELEQELRGESFIVDRCRRRVSGIDLTTRPVLFDLAFVLARAHPHDASRASLLADVFGQRRVNASLRARLRVEVGRLRKLLPPHARIRATSHGYRLEVEGLGVAVVTPLRDDEHGGLLALLGDGAAWSTAALSLALGASQRTVQRILRALHEEGRAEPRGAGRARRWVAAPLGRTATPLLLPGPGHRR